jgi:hypothetical protein
MKFLPILLATLTQHPREKANIKWSNKSWTHNLFRLYELLFWRSAGIRKEWALSVQKDKHGKPILVYSFYTLESILSHGESWIRGLIPRRFPIRLVIPMLQTPMGMGISVPSGFLFSIAVDATTDGGEFILQNSVSYNVVCSGSNLILLGQAMLNDQGVSTVTGTYNSVPTTELATGFHAANDGTTHFHYLVGPTTGTNSMAWSIVNTPFATGFLNVSYSGVKQVNPLSGVVNQVTGTASTETSTVTTTEDNSWILGIFSENGNSIVTAGANTTLRVTSPGNFDQYGAFLDTNGPLSIGSHSIAGVAGANPPNPIAWISICCAMAPVFVPAIAYPAFLLRLV